MFAPYVLYVCAIMCESVRTRVRSIDAIECQSAFLKTLCERVDSGGSGAPKPPRKNRAKLKALA